MPKVTIEDISRATGLSRGTVSRALNDRPDISTLTKQKVLEACRRLQYVPSHAARSLATGRSYAVAILLRDVQATSATGFLRGAARQALLSRYAVLVIELREPAAQAGLSSDRVDGALVVADLSASEAQWLRETLHERTIVSAYPIKALDVDVFRSDQRESGRLVARQLLRFGSAIAYVHVADDNPDGEQRREGFLEIIDAAGLPQQDHFFAFSEEEFRDGRVADVVGPRLADLRGVGASDDVVAASLMFAAERRGRVVGRDLAVIGQGNEPFARRLRPGLSSVDFCGEEIGQRAMEAFLQRLSESRQDAPQTVLVAPAFMERESSAGVSRA
jgi:LacI family transcriptional regulator